MDSASTQRDSNEAGDGGERDDQEPPFAEEPFARLELALSTIAATLKAMKVARGTRDVTEKASAAVRAAAAPAPSTPAPAPAPTTQVSLRSRIELALRAKSMDIGEIARATHMPIAKIQEEIRILRREARIANVGVVEHPVWTWRVGDNTSLAELRGAVERLISERPMTTRELTTATGARFTRVGGAIVEIQRSGKKILNMSTGGRAGRWLLIEHARDARLAPKKPKPKD